MKVQTLDGNKFWLFRAKEFSLLSIFESTSILNAKLASKACKIRTIPGMVASIGKCQAAEGSIIRTGAVTCLRVAIGLIIRIVGNQVSTMQVGRYLSQIWMQNIRGYYVIHPIPGQASIARRMMRHNWKIGLVRIESVTKSDLLKLIRKDEHPFDYLQIKRRFYCNLFFGCRRNLTTQDLNIF